MDNQTRKISSTSFSFYMLKNADDNENRIASKRFVTSKIPSSRPVLNNIVNIQGGNLRNNKILKSKITNIKSKKTVVVVEEPVNDDDAMDTSDAEKMEAEPVTSLLKYTDIDANDKDNPQLVSCYINKIYEYLRHLETVQSIRPFYLNDQADVTWKMRAILVDWLVQVSMRFHVLQETLYLTVAIIDRFLQNADIRRCHLQLVGITSMMIAAKYEEVYAPEIVDFVYITDDAYSKDEIRSMERRILKALDFNLGRPLPLHFLRRYSKAGGIDAQQHTLAKYLMELTLLEYALCHVKPSEIAAAALCLSMKILQVPNRIEWTDTLIYYTTYSESSIYDTMCFIAYLVSKSGSGKNNSVFNKYQSSKVLKVSTFPQLKSDILMNYAYRHEENHS